MRIDLASVRFSERERTVVESGALSVTAFRYDSDVAALRVKNAVGEVILLPFHGQQIWDATFYGRGLKMRSVFSEPAAATEYLSNYGAFLLHCGAQAMGNPGPTDTHPLHGALPHAQFQEAWLTLGIDAGSRHVTLSGTYRHRVAFGANYLFSPSLRVAENTGRLRLEVSVRNTRSKPMDLMYLAHINFRPVNGARILDAIPDDRRFIRLRRRLPEFFAQDESYQNLVEQITADPATHRDVVAGRAIDPELVFGLDCVPGLDGWAHALQRLPDGTADFVSHRPAELQHAVRWMTRNGDEDALGLVLPATAEADGHDAEVKKGNVGQLAPGAEFRSTIDFGALTALETRETEVAIAAARDRS
ncbi:MAG: DUF4432 family protein [Devosia sp.]